MSYSAAIEAQGSLVRLGSSLNTYRPNTPHRGIVTRFSRNSRRRLITKMRRLDQKITEAKFITLTYPARFPDGKVAKDHQRALLERMRRAYPQASCIWRLEYQKRGAPHFHQLWFNLPYVDFEKLRTMWSEIISDYVDDQLPFVRIERVRSRRGIMFYVGKYVAKMPDEPVDDGSDGESEQSLFNPVPYLHAGRWWGIHNQALMPWGILVKIVFSAIDHHQFMAAKRILAIEWSKVNMRDPKGCSIFTDAAYVLLSELERELSVCQKQMFTCG
jgi:hypothetical protein